MENEFDFFNNLNFGTDFTKQGLGGYGTYTDQYTTPVDTGDPNPVLIESPTGVETIPAPITPFINQGSGDGNNGITTLAQDYGYNSVFDNTNITPTRPDGTLQPQTNFEYDIEEGSIPQSDIDNLETAKNDTNVNNLINMGLVDKAKEYVKNNYGYMIMNLIFPGSGYAAKAFVEKKKEKEASAAAAKKLEEFNKVRELQALEAAKELEKEKAANQALQNAMAQGRRFYDQFGKGGEGASQTRREAGPGYSGKGTASEMGSFARGGRIGYGTGGIVTL